MLAIVFAGQGAQKAGSDADTRVLQPALASLELDLLSALRARGVTYGAVAGFSLGEWPALAAAEILDAARVVALVEKRARFMADAAEASPGGMLAVLGLEAAKVEALSRAVCRDEGIWAEPANYNAPGQTVVSGCRAGLDALLPLIKEQGGKAIPLRVSGAFHSRAMRPAADRLLAKIEREAFGPPAVPWIPNLTGAPYEGEPAMPDLLARQCCEPVRWEASIRAMAALGVSSILELGPGGVLCGLIARILPGLPCACAGEVGELEEALAKVGA